MASLYNRARVVTATTGTGTITLGAAIAGYFTFAEAGVQDADVVPYTIEDGNDFEIGTGTYTASGTTLTRTVTESKISGVAGTSAIDLSGNATVFITARAEDIGDVVGPASAVSGNIAVFDGTTGELIADGGISIANVLTEAEAAAAYQPLDSDLTALAGNGTNGLWARTGAGTGSARTVTGTANQITVTNGNGVSGAPTLSLPADVLIPTVLTVPNTGLHLLDTNASHDLIIAPGSDLSADRTLTIATGDADRTLTLNANVELAASAAQVRTGSASAAILASHLTSANDPVALTDAATVAIDWTAGINFTLTITTNRILGNPTNEIPGTWRTVFVISDGGPDELTFGNEYGGTPPTLDDITTTKGYLLSIYCRATSQFLVFAADGSPA